MSNSPQSTTKQTLKGRGLCVIIPTFNNEITIEKVVNKTFEYCENVIVVNDVCTDSTSQRLKAIPSITVVSYGENRGKGYALKVGMKKAIELGFSYAITIDSDGQHYPQDIPLFLEANIKNPGALIVGSRNLQGVDRSNGSSFANKFSNFWFFVETGRNLEDTQTGYRLYPLRKMHGLSLLTSRYEAELELLVFASWHGVKLVSIPINVFYPSREERISHFKPALDFTRISILNCFLCGMSLLYGLPLFIFRKLRTILITVYAIIFFILFSIFVFSPLIWLYLHIGKMTIKKKDRLHILIYHIARFVMLHHKIPGTNFSYNIEDKSVFDKPAIIICNHQSHLDLMCQMIFTPKIIFLTNDWVWKNPCYGIIVRNAEYYPVSMGIENILPDLKSLVERGYSIAVYPEGTRSTDCSIGRFHQGAFYLAQQLNLDILPMYLYGAGKVLPKKKHSLLAGLIHINVSKRITIKQLNEIGNLRTQAVYIRNVYIQKYKDLCNSFEQNV